ncbi:MAG TPA: hypothetical protein VI912_01920 [Candidatus Bilamarchaeaceae archaeon]|nr:hypothetical protein [Candidatus Bilamarchaeaceae archaeon]
MVFGIGEGKIELMLDRLNYGYNDTIKGKLKLELKKPCNAKELRVELFAVKSIRKTNTDFKTGRTRSTTSDETIYNFNLSLGGEQEYATKEYDFEIKTPPQPTQSAHPVPGWVSGAVDVLNMLGGTSPVRWYVSASLDRSMSLDVSKKVQITIQ